jgi:hypothetical protein
MKFTVEEADRRRVYRVRVEPDASVQAQAAIETAKPAARVEP